ncbi:MAG: hypothetical protein ACM3ML_20620 [Micromonosporaceae bacterium]
MPKPRARPQRWAWTWDTLYGQLLGRMTEVAATETSLIFGHIALGTVLT